MVLTAYTSEIDSAELKLIETVSGLKRQFAFDWLRENCRCASCYNEVTNQRKILISNVKPDIKPSLYSLSENTLDINWSDGHRSQYELDWLFAMSKVEETPQEVLWSGDMTNDIEYVTSSEIISRDGLTCLVESLMRYGVGFVTNVEPDLKSTEKVIRCIGPPQHTLFGEMWVFSDKMDHLDTAYTNLTLEAHTDTSYFIQPAGLIIFHCTKRNCTGGRTLLVDGFRAAHEVQLESPELYHCLKTVYTEFQYIEKGHHHSSTSTMIQHSPNDKIQQIRYNLYDRSARLPYPTSECSLFYRAVRRFASAVGRPDAQWWLTLKPGSMLFINNWRVLHGRSAFRGQRTITGAYLSMGNFLSRARCLGLIR